MAPRSVQPNNARNKHRAQRLSDLVDQLCSGRNTVLANKLKKLDSPMAEALISQYRHEKRPITEQTVDKIENALNIQGWFSVDTYPPKKVVALPHIPKPDQSEDSLRQFRRLQLKQLIDEHCLERASILAKRLKGAGMTIGQSLISQYLTGGKNISARTAERIEVALSLEGWFSPKRGIPAQLETAKHLPPAEEPTRLPQIGENLSSPSLATHRDQPERTETPDKENDRALNSTVGADMSVVPFEYRLWNMTDIAAYLRISPHTAGERVVNLPRFPTAIRIPALDESGSKSNWLWKAAEVIEWAMGYQGKS